MATVWAAGAESLLYARALLLATHPWSLQSFMAVRTQGLPIMSTVWAAGSLGPAYVEALKQAGHCTHLASFLDPGKHETMTNKQFKFFLDSGAYSAWSKGAAIDLDEYCAFIRTNIEHLDVYVNLDCIPGVPGSSPSEAQREEAAAQSWANFIHMTEVEGIPGVMPVYHYGEDVKWLKRMLDYGCQYIGLGGLVGIPRGLRQAWLDVVWSDHLVGPDGLPLVKVHGFGMTAVDHIFRYPWHSVDSTSWLRVTANGGIMVPRTVNGEFVFDRGPLVLSVSTDNPRTGEEGKHLSTLAPTARAQVERWVAMCGKTLEQCTLHYSHRAVVNVSFFKHVSAQKQTRALQMSGHRRASLW